MKETLVITLSKQGRTYQASVVVDGAEVFKTPKRRDKRKLMVELGWRLEHEKLL